MKKFIASVLILAGIAGVIFLLTSRHGSSASSGLSATSSGLPGHATSSTSSSKSYKDGNYTGKAYNNEYGAVQVKTTVNGGKITDITFLQLPNDRQHSAEISSYSSPILKQQALDAQSSQIDGVSGATSTSESFVRSLDSALAQAS